MKYYLKGVCCYCGATWQGKECSQEQNGKESHGECPECSKYRLMSIEAYLQGDNALYNRLLNILSFRGLLKHKASIRLAQQEGSNVR